MSYATDGVGVGVGKCDTETDTRGNPHFMREPLPCAHAFPRPVLPVKPSPPKLAPPRTKHGRVWPAMWLAVLACLGIAALPTAAAATGGTDSGALARVAHELGWRIESTTVATPRIEGGTPCRRASLAEAQAASDLRLRLPQNAGEALRRQALQQALDAPASLCAFGFRLGDATRRATARLQANPGFRFTAVQLGWVGFGWRGARAQGWREFRSFGRGYQPAVGNTRALDAFYAGHVRTECGTGRQVAQLATLRELFGDAAFDRDFSAGELSIGTFLTLHDSDSILLGTHAGQFFADGKAEKTARLGRQAFMGVPGFIEHVFDASHVDDIANQAENFVVADVDAAAADALAAHGGLRYYDTLNRQLWALSRQMPRQSYRFYERVLFERDDRPLARMPRLRKLQVARMRALLDDPFYRGFMVYVHPQGVRPIGFHIARLLDRNPRTPYAIDLALHNLHTTIYRRWLDSRLQARAGTGTAAAALPAGD